MRWRRQAMMKEAPEIVVIDVRTPEEFAAGHIKGAKNIDFTAGDFKAKISELDRGVTYLMHCQSGGRSGNAMPGF
jgi:rhodanese-related sulfurtransferase